MAILGAVAEPAPGAMALSYSGKGGYKMLK